MKFANRKTLIRLIGIVLVVVLIIRLDFGAVLATLLAANPLWVALAALLIIPLIGMKTVRWQVILHAQGIRYRFGPAFLAYFASLAIGFITPGRLGEFAKSIYVSEDCGTPSAIAFASVLSDRLFDLAALAVVGAAALAGASLGQRPFLLVVGFSLLLAGMFWLFLAERPYGWMRSASQRLGSAVRSLFEQGGWVAQLRLGLKQASPASLLAASLITVLSYALFYTQCYFLALALDLGVDFLHVTYAVALGSLVTLLPISISGLGTREAVMILYLGQFGVAAELSLSYSLLVFTTFYIIGGLIGGAAWLLKPLSLSMVAEVD